MPLPDDTEASDASSSPAAVHLGLALDGGVSAGCYTAGVLDFLVEALDAWQAALACGDESAPRHPLVLQAMAGTSAGAETAALLATVLRSDFPHVQLRDGQADPADADDNPLFRGWVHGADAQALLGRRDWSDGAFRSLLDGSATDEIAEDVLARAARRPVLPVPRPWLADPLHLAFTITHLEGVPLARQRPGLQLPPESFRLHADGLRFSLTGFGAAPGVALQPGDHALGFPANPTELAALMKPVMAAAAASGALPVLLPERLLKLPGQTREPLRVPVPAGGPAQATVAFPLNGVPQPPPAGPVRVVAGDGGFLGGDPSDFVRERLLAAGPGRQVVLRVDPLFKPVRNGPRPAGGLAGALPHRLLGALLSALTAHARRPPPLAALEALDGLTLHALVTPCRPGRPDEPDERALASSVLGAFGGYLHLDYRRHDYQLGRRNAQHALRHLLVLPDGDPLFRAWTPAQRAAQRSSRSGQPSLPLIPLLGRLRDDEPVLPWPSGRAPLGALAPRLGRRLDVVVQGLLMSYLPRSMLLRWLGLRVWRWVFARRVRCALLDFAAAALRKHGH